MEEAHRNGAKFVQEPTGRMTLSIRDAETIASKAETLMRHGNV